MQINNPRIIKEGEGQYGHWTIVGFTDGQGRKISTFDAWIADVQSGSEIPGKITETEKDGTTYLNFKADKNPPIDAPAVYTTSPTNSPTNVSVPKARQEPDWDAKERMTAKMAAWKDAAMLYEGTGKEAPVKKLAAEIYQDIMGAKIKTPADEIELDEPFPSEPTEENLRSVGL